MNLRRRIVWDKHKRLANLAKHGLDFADAQVVLDSLYRLDVEVIRGGEPRVLSFSYVAECLCVLVVVQTERNGAIRVISFRPASRTESEVYHEWLESE